MPLVDPVTMSSSPAKGGSGPATPAKSKDGSAGPSSSSATTLAPVRINPNPLAQATRHAVPAIHAAIFAFRFRDLVADPVTTMWTSLPLVALPQLGYALVCLPAAGSQSAKPARKTRPGEKKKPGEGSGPNVIVVRLDYPLLACAQAHGSMALAWQHGAWR